MVGIGLSTHETLEKAYREGIRRLAELSQEYFRRPLEDRPPFTMFMDQNRLFADIVELESWVYPRLHLPEERTNRVKMMEASAIPYKLTKLLLDSMKPDKGRPIKPEVRQAAIKFVEMKRRKQTISWMQFAIKNCPSRDHNEVVRYRETVRQAVMKLKKLMRRLKIPVAN
jgi:hypothetical protein